MQKSSGTAVAKAPKQSSDAAKTPKKRGRKSKQELIDIINGTTTLSDPAPPTVVPAIQTAAKAATAAAEEKNPRTRRGRKPNSVKIMDNVHAIKIDALNPFENNNLPSTILHLKCRVKDTLEMNNYIFCDISQNNKHSTLNHNLFDLNQDTKTQNTEPLINYNYSQILDQTNNDTQFDVFPNEIKQPHVAALTQTTTAAAAAHQPKYKLKELNKKIKHLDFILSSNIEIKKSACFWCTEKFEGPTIYIPKACTNNVFHVVGNFCSLECAAAHLMKSSVHQSTIMEQYALLHSLYLDRQPNFSDCIKPAPEPRYMLDKFMGNLTIEEYRELNRNGRFFILLDKPVVKITPEYHEEYSNFKIQETNIPTASS